MLKLSKKSEYGIIALKHILNQPQDSVTSAKDIARLYQIPPEIMAKILQTLARKEIVRSSQGARGGYILGRNGDAISLSDIIEAIEGPLGLVDCAGSSDSSCAQLDSCNISDPLKVIQAQFRVFLSNISLASINNEIEMQQVAWH